MATHTLAGTCGSMCAPGPSKAITIFIRATRDVKGFSGLQLHKNNVLRGSISRKTAKINANPPFGRWSLSTNKVRNIRAIASFDVERFKMSGLLLIKFQGMCDEMVVS